MTFANMSGTQWPECPASQMKRWKTNLVFCSMTCDNTDHLPGTKPVIYIIVIILGLVLCIFLLFPMHICLQDWITMTCSKYIIFISTLFGRCYCQSSSRERKKAQRKKNVGLLPSQVLARWPPLTLLQRNCK
jgi:hypothetical protein